MGLKAIELAQESGWPSVLAAALAARIYGNFQPDRLELRMRLIDEMEEAVELSGRPNLMGQVHGMRIACLLELGRIDLVDAEIEKHAEIARESNRPARLLYDRAFKTMRALLGGQYEEAEAMVESMGEFGARAELPDAIQFKGIQLLYLRLAQGRGAELVEALEEMVERYPGIPAWRTGLARIYCRLGRDEEASEQLEAIKESGFLSVATEANWLAGVGGVCEVAAHLGDADVAAEAYELLLPYANRILVSGLFAACWGSAHRYLGLAAGAFEDWDKAAVHFERSIGVGRSVGAPNWIADDQIDLALALRKSASPDETRISDLLDEAVAAARKLELEPLLVRAAEARDAAAVSRG